MTGSSEGLNYGQGFAVWETGLRYKQVTLLDPVMYRNQFGEQKRNRVKGGDTLIGPITVLWDYKNNL